MAIRRRIMAKRRRCTIRRMSRKVAAARVRIKDVARHARVSVGTVSHVLSGRVQVSAPLRARVQKSIDALGYVPNFHAQRLRHSLSRVVGLCLPHTSTEYLNTVSQTFEEVASRHGYGVMHVFSRHDPATELDRIKELIHYRVDGLALLPSAAPREALDFVAKKDVPLVIVDRPIPDRRFDQVILDNRTAMREVAERLAGLGHAKLVFVCRSRTRLVTQHRLAGLTDARKRTGIESECIEFRNDDAFLRDELARAL
jgi:LacI family transcriptional regulator